MVAARRPPLKAEASRARPREMAPFRRPLCPALPPLPPRHLRAPPPPRLHSPPALHPAAAARCAPLPQAPRSPRSRQAPRRSETRPPPPPHVLPPPPLFFLAAPRARRAYRALAQLAAAPLPHRPVPLPLKVRAAVAAVQLALRAHGCGRRHALCCSEQQSRHHPHGHSVCLFLCAAHALCPWHCHATAL